MGVGASGAIFGVYGALLAFVLLHRGVLPPAYLVQQRNSIIGFIGYNVVFGLSQKNTDMAAHAGGFVIGALAGAMLGRDLLQPEAGRLRRALGAAGVTALLLFSGVVVQRRLQQVPEIKASRNADAALAHLQAKEYPQAVARCTEALAHERRHAWLFNRGLAHLGVEDPKSARQDIHDADLMESTVKSKALLCDLGASLEHTGQGARRYRGLLHGGHRQGDRPQGEGAALLAAGLRASAREAQRRLARRRRRCPRARRARDPSAGETRGGLLREAAARRSGDGVRKARHRCRRGGLHLLALLARRARAEGRGRRACAARSLHRARARQ